MSLKYPALKVQKTIIACAHRSSRYFTSCRVCKIYRLTKETELAIQNDSAENILYFDNFPISTIIFEDLILDGCHRNISVMFLYKRVTFRLVNEKIVR